MANFSVIFQFSNQGQGWSEIWYMEAADLTEAVRKVKGMSVATMVSFRSDLTVLRQISIRDVTRNRNAQPIPFNVKGAAASVSNEGADVTSVACVYTITAPSIGASRRVWLRGLPDYWTRRDPNTGKDAPPSQLTNRVNNYIKMLNNNGFQIRALAKLTPNQYYNVLKVRRDFTTPAQAQVIVTGPALPVKDSRFILSDLSPKICPGMNGHYTILSSYTVGVANSPDQYYLTVKYNPPSTWPENANPELTWVTVVKGRGRGEDYAYGPIDNYAFLSLWSRDTGKALGLHRGRQRAKVTRAQ